MKNGGGMKEGGDGWREKSGLQGLTQAVKCLEKWESNESHCNREQTGNPRQLLLSLRVLQPSYKNAASIWENSRVARKATCPGALSVSKVVKHSGEGIGHIDMLPNNSQAQFRSEDGPEMVLSRSYSHRSLEAEALWAESQITPCQLASMSGNVPSHI